MNLISYEELKKLRQKIKNIKDKNKIKKTLKKQKKEYQKYLESSSNFSEMVATMMISAIDQTLICLKRLKK